MIDLAGAASRLGRAERQGSKYYGDCPSCGAHAAWLMPGRDGKLKAGCFRCGNWRAVKAAIDDEDFRPSGSAKPARTPAERIATGQRFWDEAISIRGPAASYLVKHRGINGPFPNTLRYHRKAWHFSGFYPALVAKIERFDPKLGSFVFAGAHVTYLSASGDKAGIDPGRLSFGVIKGAGVWLGGRGSGAIVVGEGIESTASGMVILGVSGGVAALSASGMRAIVLPPDKDPVWIVVDRDANGTGERAAKALAMRLRWRGRTVKLAIPDTIGDFNDILMLRKARP
jgi:hypothetical protein